MIKILVTGFGAFPGVTANPSSALLAALHSRRPRLARLGITLELHALPVVYGDLGARLAKLASATLPDAIVHFGLAGRRKVLSIEAQAHNHVSLLHPDAAGACPLRSVLLSGSPEMVKARLPASHILAAWQRAGIAGTLSRDAGNYICNATLYHSLVTADAACVGFIHIPALRHANARRRSRQNTHDKRACFSDIVTAAEIALIITAHAVRHSRLTFVGGHAQSMTIPEVR